jgi:hypothetical protein
MTSTNSDLESLRLPELQQRFSEVIGEETRCPNRTFLIRRIQQAISPAESANEELAAQAEESSVEQENVAADVEQAEEETLGSSVEQEDSEDLAAADVALDEPPALEEPASAATPPARIIPLKRKRTPKAIAPDNARGRFKSMTIEELQAMYLDRVGRKTGSSNRAYLIWKTREAEKGRIPIGPRENRSVAQEAAVDIRVLPLRLDVHAIEEMDAAWKAKGMKSRMEFFRRALGHYLTHIGAREAAAFYLREGES